MNFLPDVYVLCEVCNGRRYNQETLAVKFNGYSIADLLDLPIADRLPILQTSPTVRVKLETLVDVGPATSISVSPPQHSPAAKPSA